MFMFKLRNLAVSFDVDVKEFAHVRRLLELSTTSLWKARVERVMVKLKHLQQRCKYGAVITYKQCLC